MRTRFNELSDSPQDDLDVKIGPGVFIFSTIIGAAAFIMSASIIIDLNDIASDHCKVPIVKIMILAVACSVSAFFGLLNLIASYRLWTPFICRVAQLFEKQTYKFRK